MMKKVLLFLLLFIVPVSVFATTFQLDGTDMRIDFDESIWYVFTPDNILNNEELDELGLTYEYIKDAFDTNDAYLNALLLFEDSDDYIEIFVRRVEIEDIVNLMNCDDDFIDEFGSALAEEQDANYEVYQNDYPFVMLDYQDAGLYLNEYYTIINGYTYIITVQKPYAFTEEDFLRVREIVDTIHFDIDESLKEPSNSIDYSIILCYAIIGALVGAFAFGLAFLIRKKTNKKLED